ncbi:MAG: acyl-CoA dehydrogenase family protein [Halobacteria archaeon]
MVDYREFREAAGLNWYEADPNLRRLVGRLVPREDRAWAEAKLLRAGEVIGGPVAARAEVTDKSPPRLVKWDARGNEVNRVEHHPGALETKRDLWELGAVTLPWWPEARERRPESVAAVSAALTYLLSQAETGMLCAVGMTGGVAMLVERFGSPEVKRRFLPDLTAPRFDGALDGAMFLTEIDGGSDLGASVKTVARREGDRWLLNGFKWFCSNVDAGAIATLARPEGSPAGVKGIGLFLVPKLRSDGSPNGVRIRRIKEKLGTRAVPTAEVDFVEAEAHLLAEGSKEPDGRGLQRMMEMVNYSRVGVATMGAGILRRVFLEAMVYATHRRAFGRALRDWPLVREMLARMVVESEAGAALLFEAARLSGALGLSAPVEGQPLLRLLAPLAKIRCARRGLEMASLGLEVLGGNGYIEEWPAARQLRDAQCHTIWEGTENILILDVLRTVAKHGSHEALLARGAALARGGSDPLLAPTRGAVESGLKELAEALARLPKMDPEMAQLRARALVDLMADSLQGALLLREAAEDLAEGDARKAAVAHLFAELHLRTHPLRGVGSKDRTLLDLFDPLVEYRTIAPEALRKAAGL